MTHACYIWTLLWRLAPHWLVVIWGLFDDLFACEFRLCVSKLRDLLSWQRFKWAFVKTALSFVLQVSTCIESLFLILQIVVGSDVTHFIAQMLLLYSSWDFEIILRHFWVQTLLSWAQFERFLRSLLKTVRLVESFSQEKQLRSRRLQKVSLHLICVGGETAEILKWSMCSSYFLLVSLGNLSRIWDISEISFEVHLLAILSSFVSWRNSWDYRNICAVLLSFCMFGNSE